MPIIPSDMQTCIGELNVARNKKEITKMISIMFCNMILPHIFLYSISDHYEGCMIIDFLQNKACNFSCTTDNQL